MPYYCYTNRKTGETIRKFMSMSEMLKYAVDGLSIEGVWHERDIVAEHTRQTKAAGSAWPIKSDAAGVHPSQVDSFQEHSAKMGVPTEFDKSTGQAIFRSRGHRAKYLKTMGIHDRNGGYGDG
jgi:hypothetical protein